MPFATYNTGLYNEFFFNEEAAVAEPPVAKQGGGGLRLASRRRPPLPLPPRKVEVELSGVALAATFAEGKLTVLTPLVAASFSTGTAMASLGLLRAHVSGAALGETMARGALGILRSFAVDELGEAALMGEDELFERFVAGEGEEWLVLGRMR